MTKYTLIKEVEAENSYDISRVQLDIYTEHLTDLIEHFERFLQACGFVFDGHLDFQEEEKTEDLD